jgi:MoaA/NifB/PqqE/SkfB family radical SAM enzyme
MFFLRNITKDKIKFINKFTINIHDKIFDKIKFISRKLYFFLPFNIRQKIQKTLIITKKYKDDLNFDHVYFELRTKCNSQCSFCKASIFTDDRPDISMDFELYKKIIVELSQKNYLGNISFYVNNEPLLVKNLTSYIKFASAKLPKSNLRILTNGKKLNYASGKELFDAGITELEVNWYIKNIQDKVNKGINEFEDKFLKSDLNILENKSYMEFEYKNKKRIYYKILRNVDETLNSRGGSAPNWKDKEIIYDGFCSYPFWQINIKADGNVGQCCADFYLDAPNLNCKNLTIYQIWNFDFFKNLRKDLLKGNRSKNEMCKKCDFFGENFRRSENIFGKILSGLIN